MKKSKLFIAISILLTLLLLFSQIALGHPGRLDSKGGHYVRTPGWGYPVGSYHYHRSSSSSSGTSSGKSSTSNYQLPITVVVNETNIYCEVSPYLKSGTVLVPIRPISEALGATIDWDAKNNTAIISKDNIKISLPIGKQYAYRNNQKITLKVAATVKNGYTMVPVRFISESLGAKVDWDSASRTVYISK